MELQQQSQARNNVPRQANHEDLLRARHRSALREIVGGMLRLLQLYTSTEYAPETPKQYSVVMSRTVRQRLTVDAETWLVKV
jgi:hypothetical protein